jgi:hypothetical protein
MPASGGKADVYALAEDFRCWTQSGGCGGAAELQTRSLKHLLQEMWCGGLFLHHRGGPLAYDKLIIAATPVRFQK